MIEKLRDEIVESEKARTDLMKWKLILVAAIGAASFGIGSNVPTGSNPPFVLLALVPFVCLYVDAICIHTEIRIITIARFLRTGGKGSLGANSIARKYEEYCTEFRARFSLEGFALLITTLGLSLLVFILGYTEPQALIPMAGPVPAFALGVLEWSGGTGVVAGLLFYAFYRYQTAMLDK